jgi:hypothetical protein
MQRRAQILRTILAGLLMSGMLAVCMTEFPVWFSLLIVCFGTSVGKMLLGTSWPSDIRTNKFWMTLFVIGYWTCTITYFREMAAWHWHQHPIEAPFFFVMNVAIGALYIYLTNSNPGVVKPGPHNDMNFVLQRMEAGERVPDVCTTCMVSLKINPLRWGWQLIWCSDGQAFACEALQILRPLCCSF